MISAEKIDGVGLWEYVARHRPLIERALEDNLPLAPPEIKTEFNDAVRYLIFPGGKRLRPILTFLGAELFGGEPEKVTRAAAAVEYIHTSSIIFDDLPCMDNSPERRGRLSLHEKFGEGLSTLVAIGFLNHSYRLVTIDGHEEPSRGVQAVLEIVNCVGPAGMVGGQSLDLTIQRAECRTCAVRDNRHLQDLKTSSLIKLCLSLGAILSGADQKQLGQVSAFADCLGHAYQISDDLIDLEQDAECSQSKIFEVSPESLQQDLRAAAERSKAILAEHFPPCEARDCLNDLVEYVATRKE
jgi:geranylgeranyl diphosphate synthase type II